MKTTTTNKWIHTEKYAEGKYFVYCENKRIGHIVGARRTWLAEQGPINCGYYKSKVLAVNAVCNSFLQSSQDHHDKRA